MDWKNARWIKIPAEEYRERGVYARDDGGRFAFFRCEADLPENCSLKALLSASSRYRLFINGRAVLSGPCKGDGYRQYYEETDLSEYLVSGRNVFSAQVLYNDPYIAEAQTDERAAIYGVMGIPAGHRFAFEGQCIDASGGVVCDLTTGTADWRVYLCGSFYLKSTEITQYLGAVAEEIDFRKCPADWKLPDFDMTDWKRAVFGAPVGVSGPLSLAGVEPIFRMRRREIPLLYEEEGQFQAAFMTGHSEPAGKAASGGAKNPQTAPGRIRRKELPEFLSGRKITVQPNESLEIILDAGVIQNGYLRYEFRGGAGAEVSFTYFEKFGGPGSDLVRDDWEHGEVMGLTDSVILPGGKLVYEPFWFRCFRFVRVRIECAEEALSMDLPGFRRTGYPLNPTKTCRVSDPKLRALYEISLRTLENCMMETYMDCPYYEQLQFVMDTRLEAIYTYAVGGDTGLVKKALTDFHYGMQPEGLTTGKYPSAYLQILSTFSLHYIYMMQEYLEETGDLEFVREIACDADRILDYYDRHLGPLGLVGRLQYWNFVDWQDQWQESAGAPEALLHGPSTIINLMLAYALLDAEKLMASLGRTGLPREYRDRWEKLLSRIRECCYDEEKGLFREGPDFPQFTRHAQAWAVLCGLFEGPEATALLQRAIERPEVLECTFSTSYEWFRALEEAGMTEEMQKEIREWTVLLDLHCSCCPETPRGARSDCHAWSALPLYVLQKLPE